MIFSAYSFVFLFLPVTFLVFWALRRMEFPKGSIWWLIAASLFFYGCWRVEDLGLLLATIVINFFLGSALSQTSIERKRLRSTVLTVGLCLNIGLLAYFKYLDFTLENIAAILPFNAERLDLALPLGISFFSFQQSAFLIEAHQKRIEARPFSFYLFFVSFFPQLVAGPIVNFSEISKQWHRLGDCSRFWENLAVGTGMFGIGLFKKMVLADGLAAITIPFFAPHGAEWDPSFFTVWFYGFVFLIQIYFDFSSYSDMAIGLARLFGITLPMNFHSPLKATSILDFWRRWHITLTRFTTAYVFTPLAMRGHRRSLYAGEGALAQDIRGVMLPAMVTFTIVGIWHGAGWNFVLFGVIHGIYATINHFWKKLPGSSLLTKFLSLPGTKWALTMIALVPPMMIFRAESTQSMIQLCREMVTFSAENAEKIQISGMDTLLLCVAVLITLFLPNSQQFFGRYRPVLDANGWIGDVRKNQSLQWRATIWWGLYIAALYLFVWIWSTELPQEFIYFEF